MCDELWSERTSGGYWLGELASSALATATAVSALSVVAAAGGSTLQSPPYRALVERGVHWLLGQQNDDGGWGDTPRSVSNISTTMLVRAALELAGKRGCAAETWRRADRYVDRLGGPPAMVARYGKDRTFAVPILANCALAGQAEWHEVSALPFELACMPHGFYRFMRMHVVSYALPALIAIGQLIHARRPGGNLLVRSMRNLAKGPSLRKLEAIQPASGGFLEAIPLTSFVTMSLAAIGQAAHPVVRQGVRFLCDTARSDGSWPIDSNLSVWLTTLSVSALAACGSGWGRWNQGELEQTRDWLIAQQCCAVHPYTAADPGGWGWSHLTGSVPDADDTAGAILALAQLPGSAESWEAAERGMKWLVSLQNGDGGWPTFCRGWGHLPFDRSGTDLTAHALRALAAWGRFGSTYRSGIARDPNDGRAGRELPGRILRRAFDYLDARQAADGSWTPLWFGNESADRDENPTYGTSKVLGGYVAVGRGGGIAAERAMEWLILAQNPDGGWGGARGVGSSVEETGLAVEALAGVRGEKALESVRRGVHWLLDRVESGDWRNASPIGLYFAKLWYFEKLYPVIFTVAALGRARRLWNPPVVPTS